MKDYTAADQRADTAFLVGVTHGRSLERRKVVALLDALDRTESRFRQAIAGTPVRDMAETLGENAAARQLALTTAEDDA